MPAPELGSREGFEHMDWQGRIVTASDMLVSRGARPARASV